MPKLAPRAGSGDRQIEGEARGGFGTGTSVCESHTAHRHDRRAAAYHYNLRHWSPCHAPRCESPTHTTGTRPSRPFAYYKDVAPRPPTLTANLAMHLCFDAALSCASDSPNMPFPSMPSCKPMTIAGRLFFHLPVLLLPLLLLPCHDDSLGSTSRSRRLPVLFRPALSGWSGWPSRPLRRSRRFLPVLARR